MVPIIFNPTKQTATKLNYLKNCCCCCCRDDVKSKTTYDFQLKLNNLLILVTKNEVLVQMLGRKQKIVKMNRLKQFCNCPFWFLFPLFKNNFRCMEWLLCTVNIFIFVYLQWYHMEYIIQHSTSVNTWL